MTFRSEFEQGHPTWRAPATSKGTSQNYGGRWGLIANVSNFIEFFLSHVDE